MCEILWAQMMGVGGGACSSVICDCILVGCSGRVQIAGRRGGGGVVLRLRLCCPRKEILWCV